jgi:hypothetical protein
MNKVSLKKAIIFSLSLLSFNINAAAHYNKELAKQCQDLAEIVASLMSSQAKTACAEKLGLASYTLEKAGALILEHVYPVAKMELNYAIYNLQYAELISCNRYIQISHAKLEAKKIKKFL